MGIFTQYNIKRQLQALTKADDELEARSQKIDFTSTELGYLGLERILIEREKIAFAFDELKIQLKDWSTLTRSSTWKLKKPKYSEGTLFFTDTYPTPENAMSNMQYADVTTVPHRYCSEAAIVDKSSAVLYAAQIYLKPFMVKALKASITRQLRSDASSALDDVSLTPEAHHLYKSIIERPDPALCHYVYTDASSFTSQEAVKHLIGIHSIHDLPKITKRNILTSH